MKISVQDVKMINWEAVREQITADTLKAMNETVEKAMKAFEHLKPGESKTFVIKVGHVRVSKPKGSA